jgi:hypothetical protein
MGLMLPREFDRAELDDCWNVGVVGDIALQERSMLLKGCHKLINRVE